MSVLLDKRSFSVSVSVVAKRLRHFGFFGYQCGSRGLSANQNVFLNFISIFDFRRKKSKTIFIDILLLYYMSIVWLFDVSVGKPKTSILSFHLSNESKVIQAVDAFFNQISSTANVYKIDNFSLVIIKHLSSVIATYPSKTVFVKISRQSYSPPPRPIIPLLNMKLRNWYKSIKHKIVMLQTIKATYIYIFKNN